MSSSTISDGSITPVNPALLEELQGEVGARCVDRAFLAHLALTGTEAATNSTTAVHAAVTDNGAAQTVTVSITNPPVTRNITATAGGTAGDIKAIQVVITGTDEAGAVITESLPAFTVDTAGTVVGAKCFKTVTSILIPAHDGTGATTAIGFGSKIGLRHKLSQNTLQTAYINNVEEATAPTVTVDSSNLSGNGVTLETALGGTAIDVYYFV